MMPYLTHNTYTYLLETKTNSNIFVLNCRFEKCSSVLKSTLRIVYIKAVRDKSTKKLRMNSYVSIDDLFADEKYFESDYIKWDPSSNSRSLKGYKSGVFSGAVSCVL